MADEETAPAETRPEDKREEPVVQKRGFLRRHWGKLAIFTVLILPILVFTIWSGITLSFSYSSGERVGYVQKLSRKGWLCKTWEGELQMSNIPGSAPLLFQFSVRSDSVAHAIQAAEGRRVSLSYEQHVGVPSDCFGETEYFVNGVRTVTP
jgi:hypothetical protein